MILVGLAAPSFPRNALPLSPLGHFHIRAQTDFVPPLLVQRGPLFCTYCAPLTAYVNNVRHYLAPHCGWQAGIHAVIPIHTSCRLVPSHKAVVAIIEMCELGQWGER